jgi:diaminohydroxyphosphoribosylaminopyrimidine deaminase/5-amino-6-(5-phosphoribosylamino)uracil reductase
MSVHEKYINRCIELAKNGLGTTYPNPMVGSVIVHDNKIIGEGWHKKAGEAHAEVNAINSVKDQSLLANSIIYVSLEPCNHYGKTPPCSDLIIEKKIPNVVVGTIDPFSLVAGNGIKKLKQSGKTVTVSINEKECTNLNKRFFTFHTKKRPYIILKWAESADGFIAPLLKENKNPVWLSNEYSRQLVHKWRSEEQAILVGTNTVLQDNPSLTTRDWNGNNPVRIVIDKTLKIANESSVYDKNVKTIFITEVQNLKNSENCIFENAIFDKSLPQSIANIIYKHNLQSVLIEGGTQTLQSFIDASLWDEARIFISEHKLINGIKAPIINKNNAKKTNILKDQLLILEHHD